MKNILIVDDDQDAMDSIGVNLEDKYNIYGAICFEEAMKALDDNDIDVVLLDVNIPNINGFEICTEMRSLERYKNLPIIFVSGQVGTSSQVIGYKLGGDHFIEKPINFNMLEAVIERLLSRDLNSKPKSCFENLTVDHESRELLINGKSIKLKNKEFLIVTFFIKNKDRIVTREQILNAVWKSDTDVSDRVIDTHISNLRKKLGPGNCMIKNIYQEGYKIIKKK